MRGVNKAGYPVASATAALLCLLPLFVPEPLAAALAFDRQAIFGGQFWRLWSGHLVHFSTSQALLDGAVLLLAGAVAEREWGTRKAAAVLFFGAPVISCGLLLLVPEMTQYRGASALSVMLALAGGNLLWRSQPALHPGLALCGAFLIGKLVLESLGFAVAIAMLPQEVRVAWQAHVLGAGVGWLAVACERRDRGGAGLPRFVAES